MDTNRQTIHLRTDFGMVFLAAVALLFFSAACDYKQSSDDVQREQQEKILAEGTSAIGMPAIKNFRERKLMKLILELRDQESYPTYTYTFSEVTGKYSFFCDSIGYPIPYATQFTNPQKMEHYGNGGGWVTLPQADPNGLFSPASAEGTWVMCKDPSSGKVAAVYSEPKLISSPFKLPDAK